MRLSRSAAIAVFLGVILETAFAQGTPVAPPTQPREDKAAAGQHAVSQPSSPLPAILPRTFAGWQMQGSPETSADPGAADPANAAVLKEYRFTDYAASTYTQDDGGALKIRAARFADASGAFGAYTFYLQPGMAREVVGDQGASVSSSGGQRVLFYRGHILVDALFSRQSTMSAAELRELAGLLPRIGGSAGELPPVLLFMPRQNYIANTQKYAEGPVALAALGVPVSPNAVDFGAGSEVTLGHYDTPSGEATLILIYYTNPQMATDHLRRIDPAYQPAQARSGVSTIGSTGSFFYKRTGPIVAIAIATGSAESDAKSLLGEVNYKASLSWNEPTSDRDVRDLTMLVLNVVILCGVVGGLAIVAGVAFGGIRILMKRLYPDKVFDRPEQMEFISLRLTETAVQGNVSVQLTETVVQETVETGPEDGQQTPQKSA
jgi:hypothetical protein